MPTHLLDTSVYCQPLKPKPLPSVERRWRDLGDAALAISAICEAELLYGLEWKQSARLHAQYDRLVPALHARNRRGFCSPRAFSPT